MADDNVFAQTFVDIASGNDSSENFPKERIGQGEEEAIASDESEEAEGEEAEDEEVEDEEVEDEEAESEEAESEEAEGEEAEGEEDEGEEDEGEKDEEPPQPTAQFAPFKLNDQEFKSQQDVVDYIKNFRQEYPEADTAMQLYLREMMQIVDDQSRSIQKFSATQTRMEVMKQHPDLDAIETQVIDWAKKQPGRIKEAYLETLVRGSVKEINQIIKMYKDQNKTKPVAKKSSSKKPIKDIPSDKVRVLERKGSRATTKKSGGGTATFADYFREAAKQV